MLVTGHRRGVVAVWELRPERCHLPDPEIRELRPERCHLPDPEIRELGPELGLEIEIGIEIGSGTRRGAERGDVGGGRGGAAAAAGSAASAGALEAPPTAAAAAAAATAATAAAAAGMSSVPGMTLELIATLPPPEAPFGSLNVPPSARLTVSDQAVRGVVVVDAGARGAVAGASVVYANRAGALTTLCTLAPAEIDELTEREWARFGGGDETRHETEPLEARDEGGAGAGKTEAPAQRRVGRLFDLPWEREPEPAQHDAIPAAEDEPDVSEDEEVEQARPVQDAPDMAPVEPCSLEPLGVVPGMGIAPPDPEGTLV
jgi:hypothetical protein